MSILINMEMPEEHWKDINGYEGLYQVSDIGRVRGAKGILKPGKANNGYLHVSLCKDHSKRTFSVHRLVAMAFVTNTDPINNNIVNHKDENRGNNVASNLEWCTPKHNLNYGSYPLRNSNTRKALFSNRDNNWKCKRIVNIDTGEIFRSIADAGEKYYIDKSSIAKVCRGQRKKAGGYRWESIGNAPTVIPADKDGETDG